MKYCLIITTCPNLKSAKKISRILLSKKLVACANIIKNVKSIYSWKGKIIESKEFLIFLKTKKILYRKIEDTIKRNHPYEVPEIISFEIENGDKNYLNWIKGSTI